MAIDLTRAIPSPRDRAADDPMPRREWLVTNGLGGYAPRHRRGVVTRRYHGLLVASLPAPLGRMVMLNHLLERVRLPDRRVLWLGDEDEVSGPNAVDRTEHLAEFRLEDGLPVWTYRIDGFVIEKRVLMPHMQNTVHVSYRLLEGKARSGSRCGRRCTSDPTSPPSTRRPGGHSRCPRCSSGTRCAPRPTCPSCD